MNVSVPVPDRWALEQVHALAPKATSLTAAQPLAVPTRWTDTGCDRRALWGRCRGSGSEPYDVLIDHVGVAFRCTCPSRQFPCKHAIALLIMWCRGQVAEAVAPSGAAAWLAARTAAAADAEPTGQPKPKHSAERGLGGADTSVSTSADSSVARDDRVARMHSGLRELQRWIDDRVRAGMADASIARYGTWDELAARLVDSQVGGLANRVRRIAGMVGVTADWHERVLAELGLLHLLAAGGLRLGELPSALADSVAVTLGWQVRQADVLAGVPDTDEWVVMGRSDTREDRIEVRRHWLRGRNSGRWAMVLSFAAYGQSLDGTLVPGSTVRADLFRYPGLLGWRALIGARHGTETTVVSPPAVPIGAACQSIGAALAAEPWIDRCPFVVTAAPTLATRSDQRGWVLTDGEGSLSLASSTLLAPLLACSEGRAVTMTCEWTADGVVPLTVFVADRAIDVGPTADPSFVTVGAAGTEGRWR